MTPAAMTLTGPPFPPVRTATYGVAILAEIFHSSRCVGWAPANSFKRTP